MSKSVRIAVSAAPHDAPVDDPAAVDEADLLAASVARVEHRLALLDELAELAMKLSRRVTERANRPSRKPLLYKNRNYERREFEVIDPSP